MEPLGNLNKGYTVPTTRGLPFNAPCECTIMHDGSNLLFLTNLTFHTKITNSTTGWPLLGLATLPTARERSKGEGTRVTSEANVYARVCML